MGNGLSASSGRVLLTGGGTGGHVFPLVAVAEKLLRLRPGLRVVWAGRPRGFEAETVAKLGWEYAPLPAFPFKRREPLSLVQAASANLRGLAAARRLLRGGRFELILGSGGYVAVPIYAAARLRGLPYHILESNSIPGIANRLFAGGAKTVFTAFPETAARIRGRAVCLDGNPVRQGFASAPPVAAATADWKKEKLLVVMGGSQGAGTLNRFTETVGPRLVREFPEWRIFHLAGPREAAPLAAALAGEPAIRVAAFSDEIPALLKQAALVVARAGAMTLAELAFVGVPAILVPYPRATENHQDHNAASFAAGGRGVVVRETDTAATLAALEAEFEAALDPAALARMRAAGRARAGINPVDRLVAELGWRG